MKTKTDAQITNGGIDKKSFCVLTEHEFGKITASACSSVKLLSSRTLCSMNMLGRSKK